MEAKQDIVPRTRTYDEVDRMMPKNYQPCLNVKDTQKAMHMINQTMEKGMCRELNLFRTECPLLMQKKHGMNDMLFRDGSRKPVEFSVGLGLKERMATEIVQACSKWKRFALKEFQCDMHEGIFNDAVGVRKDYFLDGEHSATVHHWDWERVIDSKDRNLNFLKNHVNSVWKVVCECDNAVRRQFPALNDGKFPQCPNKVQFIHAEELLQKYPQMTRTERENEICKEMKAVFVIGIGHPLADGNPHMLRSSDYEDWITPTCEKQGKKCHGLNGDMMVWNPITMRRQRIFTMGVRVTKESLQAQLKESKMEHMADTMYHKMIMNDQLPQSIGGGIGKHRLAAFLLRKMSIGEIGVSVWPQQYMDVCKKHNVHLLQ